MATLDSLEDDIQQAHNRVNQAEILAQGRHTQWTNAHAQVQTGLTNIQNKANDIRLDTADLQRFAMTDLVGQAIQGTGESVVRMTRAFINGRNFEGGAEVLRMSGALCNLAFFAKDVFGLTGKIANWAGPIGSIIGEIFAIGTAILSGYAQAEKPLADQLKAALAEAQAKDRIDNLEGVLDVLAVANANLRAHPANSLSWDDVDRDGHITSAPELIVMGAAESFLRRERGTPNDQWQNVFETHLYARSLMLQNIMVGMRALKTFGADGRPTPDLIEAAAVIQELCTQGRAFLDEFKPDILPQGVHWFIGTNSRLYRCKPGSAATTITPHDSVATRLAVAPDGKRMFHIGSNRAVYTSVDESWHPIERLDADDVAVTTAAGDNYHLFLLDRGALKYRRWPTDDAHDKPAYNTELLKRTLVRISADQERLFGVDTSGALVVLDASGAHDVPAPSGAVLSFVSATRSSVYVAAKRGIWRAPISAIGRKTIDWQMLWWPQHEVGLGPTADLGNLFACGDGSLLAVIDKQMFEYVAGRKQPWARFDPNAALAVTKAPVKGHELFAALDQVLTDFEAGFQRLRDSRPPALPLAAPLVAEVRVLADRFEPASVTVRTGGRIRWTFENTGHGGVKATSPAFASPAGATTFAFDFAAAGKFAYTSGDGRLAGTIKVETPPA